MHSYIFINNLYNNKSLLSPPMVQFLIIAGHLLILSCSELISYPIPSSTAKITKLNKNRALTGSKLSPREWSQTMLSIIA